MQRIDFSAFIVSFSNSFLIIFATVICRSVLHFIDYHVLYGHLLCRRRSTGVCFCVMCYICYMCYKCLYSSFVSILVVNTFYVHSLLISILLVYLQESFKFKTKYMFRSLYCVSPFLLPNVPIPILLSLHLYSYFRIYLFNNYTLRKPYFVITATITIIRLIFISGTFYSFNYHCAAT